MDHLSHFRREVAAFAAVARKAVGSPAPMVPSCPAWSVSDLVMHLGGVHRYVTRIIDERLTLPPDPSDRRALALPADLAGWPDPLTAPNVGPVPDGLPSWFASGASALADRFASTDPSLPVWTWSSSQTVEFWLRMQTIEAAVHRWDIEAAMGSPAPLAAPLAADAVAQTFEVMAPARRAWLAAPEGSGERLAFRQTDGPARWTATFDGAEVRLSSLDGADVEVAGTASDLALFLWQRIPADRLTVTGDRAVLDRYFTLVPPI